VIEHRAQAALPLRHVTHRRRQKIQPAFNLRRDLVARQNRRPGRRQLDPQRHPLHHAADGGRRSFLLIQQHEADPRLASALHKKLHRRVRLRLRAITRGRHGQPLNDKHPFALQIQPLARGDEQLHPGRARQDLGQQADAVRLQQMLNVIQHEQHLPVAQMLDQLIVRVSLALKRQPQAAGNGRNKKGRRRKRRQRHKADAIRKAAPVHRRRLDRQTRLADAPCADQREQPAQRVVQQPAQCCQFRLSPQQRRQIGRQVVRSRDCNRPRRPLPFPWRCARQAQPLRRHLPPRHARKRVSILLRHLQRPRQQPGKLLGRTPLARLDLAQREHRASRPLRQLSLRQIKRLPPLLQPVAV